MQRDARQPLLQGTLEQRNSQPFPPVVHAWLAATNSE